jgi:hypothetical protein
MDIEHTLAMDIEHTLAMALSPVRLLGRFSFVCRPLESK